MKVLIVVDVQRDFIDLALGTPEAQATVPKIVDTITRMASPDTVCIFTKDTHDEDYMTSLEGINLPVPHCIKGTVGHAIHHLVLASYYVLADTYKKLRDIVPIYEDNIIEKPTFGSIELQNMLYNLNEYEPIEEITFVGFCTGICVQSNALLAKATLPEVPINVIADCCACVTPESHERALEAMKLCQINII